MSTKKRDKADLSKSKCDVKDTKEQVFEKKASDPQEAANDNHGCFLIVGIGASAGGLAAFETFFSNMPTDTDPGMAFILVQHLAPDHKSILTDIIRGYTRMQVFEAEDGMKVMPNCVYIIPPNRDMALLNGRLHLLKPATPHGRLPIDYFFRSLAQDQHELAIGIILSGTGSDGSQGVRAIKGEGGMVIVQAPETTEHNGMLRSAIATGAVDCVLPIEQMPVQLLDYAAHAFGKRRDAESPPAPKEDSALKKIFIILRSAMGNDFSQYKTTTVYRRIERRMAINQIEKTEDYVRYLQQSKTEAEALYYDLLIGVTQFFRDADAFRVLEESGIPAIFADKPEGSALRVWVPCCSTGEEAYSIAILLSEYMEAHSLNYPVQIFVTDIDRRAVAAARAGVYPAGIASDISPERLRRFFSPEPSANAYRINKSIRDMLIFSEQNIIRDPPFSKLDLISCRNFLIYLNKDLQKKLIALFHYSLSPGGLLFLGNSENFSESAMFTAINHGARLFKSKKTYSGQQKTSGQMLFPADAKFHQGLPPETEKSAQWKKPIKEIAEKALLSRQDMAGALVNSAGKIIYLHGRSGLYLEPAPGEAELNNILKMAREGLKYELTAALHRAAERKEVVRRSGLKVKTNGHFEYVNVSVHPLGQEDANEYGNELFLVVLEIASRSEYSETEVLPEGGREEDMRIEALKRELHMKEEYLQAANEELETANEELSSSNEEMQSINEEMQSTNEELETSREELQSMNEELSTVNAELQTKVNELSKLNNDMNNMFSGTGIGTVFVDHQLRIMRFTPTATDIINLIKGDVGRPISHIVSNLTGNDSLVEDIKEVLHTLGKKQAEVKTSDGKWYSMQIRPYRTTDNVIEGAVITFVDITDLKHAQEALMTSEMRFRRLFEAAKDGILILDAMTGDIREVNKYLLELLGYTREIFLGKKIWDIGFFKDVIANKEKFIELREKEFIRYDNLPLETSDGKKIEVEFISSVYDVNREKVIQCSIRDITERKVLEEVLVASETRFRRLFETAQDGILTLDARTGDITGVNQSLMDMLGYSQEQFIMKKIWDLGFFRDVIANKEKFAELQENEYVRYDGLPLETADGRRIDVEFVSSVYKENDKKVIQCAIRERKKAEGDLK